MPFQANFPMAVWFLLLTSSLGHRFPLFVIQGECEVIGPELTPIQSWAVQGVSSKTCSFFFLTFIFFSSPFLYTWRPRTLSNAFHFLPVCELCMVSQGWKSSIRYLKKQSSSSQVKGFVMENEYMIWVQSTRLLGWTWVTRSLIFSSLGPEAFPLTMGKTILTFGCQRGEGESEKNMILRLCFLSVST